MTVILGGNQFIDCQNILSYRGQAVLRVLVNPLRVEINAPADIPGAPNPVVLRNVQSERSFGVFTTGDRAVALATLLDPEREIVHLTLDLRPLGMNIYDDPQGLHVGNNLFSMNVIEGAATAISLG